MFFWVFIVSRFPLARLVSRQPGVRTKGFCVVFPICDFVDLLGSVKMTPHREFSIDFSILGGIRELSVCGML